MSSNFTNSDPAESGIQTPRLEVCSWPGNTCVYKLYDSVVKIIEININIENHKGFTLFIKNLFTERRVYAFGGFPTIFLFITTLLKKSESVDYILI